jgi:uncharacterized membrane protein YjfL (UPF0719 family)
MSNTVETFLMTAAYAGLGIFLMVGSILLANILFKLDLRKELIEDQNNAFAILFAGIAIAISIIIASSIV